MSVANGAQGELFALLWHPHPFKLRAGDVFKSDGRLCRVLRVNECAAVIIMNRPVRQFTTRLDKPVRFQPGPLVFRISPNSEVKVINPKTHNAKKRKTPLTRLE